MVGQISLGLGIEVLKTSRLQVPVVSCAQLTVQPGQWFGLDLMVWTLRGAGGSL